MKLTTSNVVSGNIVSGKLTIGNNNIVNSLNLGNVSFTPSAVTVGNVSITPSAVSTPQLVVGGISYAGGSWGGILDYQEFTTAGSGTWYNPYANASANASLSGSEQVLVMAWGGGGGATTGTDQGGGGGGACAIGHYKLSDLASTVSVIVGAGATGATTGGTTSFGSLNAYGGGPGQPAASGRAGAGGGGLFSAGLIGSSTTGGAGGGPVGGAGGASGAVGTAGTFGGGGGGGQGANGAPSIFGGGGGGGGNPLGAGGSSIFGGGGGAGSTNTPTTGIAGLSVFGGNGANSVLAAAAPGGGGSARAASPNGARGEVRVWTFGIAGTTLGAPTYSLTANTTTLYEGSSVLYTVSTTNVANGTTLYYTLNNSSTAVSSDFSSAVNGSVVINGGTGTFTLTANNDAGGIEETFQLDIRTGNTSGIIVTSNNSFSIPEGTRLTYLNSTSNIVSSGGTLTVPSGTQVGDLIVYYNFAADGGFVTTPPTAVTPPGTGWTTVQNQTVTNDFGGLAGNYSARSLMYCKKAESSDLSSTFTAMTTTGGAPSSISRVISFRPRSGLTISALANNTPNMQFQTATVTSVTTNMSAAVANQAIIAISSHGAGSLDSDVSPSLTGGTGTQTSLDASGKKKMRIEVQDRNFANVTASQPDVGTFNLMGTTAIIVTF